MMTHEELLKILRRVPADRFVKQAIAMVTDGEMPDVELLRRCGLRMEDGEVIA